MRRMMLYAVVTTVVLSGALGAAQTRGPEPGQSSAVALQQTDEIRQQQLSESRYQIGQMERLLEGAVEHGAALIRDRLQRIMPADMLLTENARARGFRLEHYGVFFDVEVPSLQGSLPWSFRTLDQNALGIDSALQRLRAFVAAANDVDLQQALKRIELQVVPANGMAVPVALGSGQANVAGFPATSSSSGSQAQPDPILKDPNEEYRAQIREALIDAMLEHSRGLNIGATEWLTVAARSSDDRLHLTSADSDLRTVVISVRGADLKAFLGGQIPRDEARKRVDVRVF